MTRKSSILILAGLLLAISPSGVAASQSEAPGSKTPDVALARAEAPPGTASKVLDVAFVRPLCMIGSWVTTGIFLGTLPITFMTGVSEGAADVLVLAPWRFTSARYAGDFERYKDGLDAFERPR